MGEVIKFCREGKFIGWYIRYYDASGRRVMRASKQPTQAEARKMLVQIEAKIARGLAGVDAPQAAPITVAELCEQFLATSHLHVKDAMVYRRQARAALRWALPILGASGSTGSVVATLNKPAIV